MTENERYCVRAGYWHNYTGIGRCEDENLTTNEVCDLINEQNETINNLQYELMALMDNYQELKTDEKQLSISFIGYKQKVKETLQSFIEATKTMKQMKGANKLVLDSYIDLIKHIADELGVDLE